MKSDEGEEEWKNIQEKNIQEDILNVCFYLDAKKFKLYQQFIKPWLKFASVSVTI